MIEKSHEKKVASQPFINATCYPIDMTSEQKKKTRAIANFNHETEIKNWEVVNDSVMGGLSKGRLEQKNDYGHFFGTVSLKNNGGFTSIRKTMAAIDLQPSEKFQIRLKGDGKKYQFRVKEKPVDQHAYFCEFSTSKDWEVIDISFMELKPIYRGNLLDVPAFSGHSLEQVGFLIANGQAESFSLLIDEVLIL